MRVVRGLGGAVLWLLASILTLLAIVLCITIILLPVGLALFRVGRRLYSAAVRLMLPRKLSHPAQELRSSVKDHAKAARNHVSDLDLPGRSAKKKMKKVRRRAKAAIG